jgi:Transglycosylase SLT domain
MPLIRTMRPAAIAVIAAGVLGGAVPGHASNDEADLCLRAAARASDQTGVPYDVLLAVATVESGRDGQPWPWTVNIGGTGHWQASASEAADLAETALQDGLTSIDLGCFQLNIRWHAGAFASVEDMLDPERNAIYAAEYLAKHFARTGDWPSAAAAYHSATPEHADRYRARFETAWSGLSGAEVASGETAESPANGFPLLVGGGTGSRGSLVPATAGGLRLIGAP